MRFTVALILVMIVTLFGSAVTTALAYSLRGSLLLAVAVFAVGSVCIGLINYEILACHDADTCLDRHTNDR